METEIEKKWKQKKRRYEKRNKEEMKREIKCYDFC